MEPTRVAIIGGGWIAEKVYLPYLLSHARFQVAAAYDTSEEALFRLAKIAGLPEQSLSFEACFSASVDGVILCTPPSAHPEQIGEAVLAKKYVLCEKPVFRGASEVPGVVPPHLMTARLMGSATMRLRKDVGLVLDWVRHGMLGSLRRVHLGWWRERGVPAPGSWRTDPVQSPKGVLEDLGPHLLDMIASLTRSQGWERISVIRAELNCKYGSADRGAAWFKGSDNTHYTVPDQAYVEFVTDSGTTIEVEVSWTDDAPGDLCSVVFEGVRGKATFKGLMGFSTSRRCPEQFCSLELDGHRAQTHHFSTGPELQRQAFGESIEIFRGFCGNQCAAVSNYNEISEVAEWLSAVYEASGWSTQPNSIIRPRSQHQHTSFQSSQH